MNAAERDRRLERVDQSVEFIVEMCKEIKGHQKTQNGILLDHTEQIAYNTQGRRSMKWVIGGIIFALVPLFVVLFNAVL